MNTTLRHGSLSGARLAALDLPGGLDLGQALAMLLLIADQDPARYARTAARWLAKLTSEISNVELGDALDIAQLLTAMAAGTTNAARRALADALDERNLARLASRALELPTTLQARDVPSS